MSRRALLVIDMQRGCFAGDPPRLDETGVVARINALGAAIRPAGAVVFVQHTVEEQGYARGSDAWSLLPTLQVLPEDLRSEKTACDAFLETDLHAQLQQRQVNEVWVVGCATDFCVDTTIRAAAALGYRVVVPTDAHTTRDRPYLDARTIIAHHHAMWTDLLLPRGARITLATTSELLRHLRGGTTAPA